MELLANKEANSSLRPLSYRLGSDSLLRSSSSNERELTELLLFSLSSSVNLSFSLPFSDPADAVRLNAVDLPEQCST